MAKEEWKKLEGYGSRYFVSPLGRVKNSDGLVLKLQWLAFTKNLKTLFVSQML